MAGRCIIVYLGPELPEGLGHLKGLMWVPAVRVEPRMEELSRAVSELSSGVYDCAAITSPRTPRLLKGLLPSWPVNVRAFCSGFGTAAALREVYSVHCESPEDQGTRGLAKLMVSRGCSRILSLRAMEGDSELEGIALGSGVAVTRLNIYNEVIDLDALRDLSPADVVLVTSAVIARAVCASRLRYSRAFIAIGPKSAQAIKDACPDANVVVAPKASFDSLAALVKGIECNQETL